MSMQEPEQAKVMATLPAFGGKRTLGPRIAHQLGEHGQYFEPFCLSLATLFAKKKSQKETVNDLHGDAINLARVLRDIDLAEQLYDRLNRFVFDEGALWDAREQLGAGFPDVGLTEVLPDRAYWYFLASWMGRNGTAGTARQDYQIAVRWTKGGGSPTVRFRNCIESIPWWHWRLQNVVILKRDALKIVGRFEDVKQTAIYADPPYHAGTRSINIKNGKGNQYLHEFRHEGDLSSSDPRKRKSDHELLAEILCSYKHARIVVSYYDSPTIRSLYPGWSVIECTMNKQLHAQNGRGARSKAAPEILLINGSIYPEDESHARSSNDDDEASTESDDQD